jgi:hypothetical protein
MQDESGGERSPIMSKVVGGGQKKSVSANLRSQRNVDAKKGHEQVAKQTNAAQTSALKQPAKAPATKGAESAVKAEHQVQKPTVQSTRVEVHHKAAEHGAKAHNEFGKDLQASKQLGTIKSGENAGRKPLTEKAVNSKSSTVQPDMKKAPQQGTAKLAEAARQVADTNRAQQNAVKLAQLVHKKTPQKVKKEGAAVKDTIKNAPKAKLAAPTAETAAMAVVAKPLPRLAKAETGGKKDGVGKKDGAKEKRGAKGTGKAAGADKSKELNALLGGDVSSEGHEPEEFVEAAAHEVGFLEEGDPRAEGLVKVINEYDTENPGIEAVLAKAQFYKNKILQEPRLSKAADLDESLGEKIADMFETPSLSSRIVGKLKDEFKEDLSVAKFLYSSVYNGGLIG